MECNKEEAKRAMDIAERKLSENDYLGAKKFINKAQSLYPNLYGLKQVLMIVNVYIAASNKTIGEESDWYGILDLDPLADDQTVKKQYKKLAFMLHPDRNKFNGAEEAVKLVNNARDLLTDKLKRRAYDQKRKWDEVNQRKSGMQQKPVPKPHEPASSSTSSASNDSAKEAQESWNRRFEESREKAASSTTTSASNDDSAKAAKEAQERWTRWFQESRGNVDAAFAREKANETERLFKKPTTTTTRNSTSDEAERLFKKPMSSGDHANSTFEAERLFKKSMTSGYANSTFGAQRIFRKQTYM